MRATTTMCLLLTGCGGASSPDRSLVDPVDGPTWFDEVQPIAAERCARCHRPGGIGSFLDLTDGDAAAIWADAIADTVAAGRMPPYPADGGLEPEGGVRNDPRMTDDERATWLAWAEAGAPLGATRDVEVDIPVDTLSEVSAEVRPAAPVRVPPATEAADTFLCLVLDPDDRPDDVWLDAFEVAPDVGEVVHHVLISKVRRDDALERDAADGTEDGVYPCFGGIDIAESNLVAGWIPGGEPLRYPDGSGERMTPDEVLVAQMHYHGVAEERFDQTAFRLHWQTAEPERLAVLRLVGNARSEEQGLLPGPNDDGAPTFAIPADAADHVETSRHPLSLPGGLQVRPFMVAPHMHLIGVEITVWLEHPDGSREVLIDVPRYDYDWQLFYFLDETLPARTASDGDAIVVQCVYDNRLDNPSVARALQEAGLDDPVDVALGEGTLDEMCLVGLGAVPI